MKIKLTVPVFIMLFLLGACSTATVVSEGSMIPNDNYPGSIRYVADKMAIANKSGSRNALASIIDDVNRNGAELDKNDPQNILRFYKLVCSLIYKSGNVDMELHYFRNKLNRAPGSLKDMITLNSTLPINKRWVLLGIINSSYHLQGTDGEYNLKFVSANGFCEAVYNKKGILLNEKNDPVDMGTFNYAAGIKEINAHEKYDIAPYLKWGNTPDSPEKDSVSINKGVFTALLNYKAHSASVFLYRKNLFGMQQGRVP